MSVVHAMPHRLLGATLGERERRRTPASQTRMPPTGSKLSTRFRSDMERTISSCTGTLPPTKPVLPPCASVHFNLCCLCGEGKTELRSFRIPAAQQPGDDRCNIAELLKFAQFLEVSGPQSSSHGIYAAERFRTKYPMSYLFVDTHHPVHIEVFEIVRVCYHTIVTKNLSKKRKVLFRQCREIVSSVQLVCC